VILCEGNIDNVYLRLAIRRLAADFPELAEITKQKIVVPKVRIYKHPKSSTTRLLDLGSGGYAALGSFMSKYKKETEDFGPGLTESVIIVYENESGGASLRNKIEGSSRSHRMEQSRSSTFSRTCTQVVNDRLLVPVDPAGEDQEEEGERGRQRVHRRSVPERPPWFKECEPGVS
jgi:hypothetical protein